MSSQLPSLFGTDPEYLASLATQVAKLKPATSTPESSKILGPPGAPRAPKTAGSLEMPRSFEMPSFEMPGAPNTPKPSRSPASQELAAPGPPAAPEPETEPELPTPSPDPPSPATSSSPPPAGGADGESAKAPSPSLPEPDPSPPARVQQGFEPPEGSLALRLQHLLDWLGEGTGCTQSFVADHEGLPLLNSDASPAMVAVAASVGTGWKQASSHLELPRARSFSVDLEGDLRLHLLAEPGPWGDLTLGFGTREAVGNDRLTLIAEAFRQCLLIENERTERL